MEGKPVGLAGPVRNCPYLDFLGIRMNWCDYSRQEQQRILGASMVFFPTILYFRQLTAMGVPIYPGPVAYSVLGDKIAQLSLFRMGGLPMPRTRVYTGSCMEERIMQEFSFPFIGKIPYGSSLGRGVFFISDHESLRNYLQQPGPAYIQEYLPIDRDIRVVIIGGRIQLVYWKLAQQGEFRTNVALGGRISFDPVPDPVLELAMQVPERTGIDHAGLDICWYDGMPYLLEANIQFGRQGMETAGLRIGEIICSMIGQGGFFC